MKRLLTNLLITTMICMVFGATYYILWTAMPTVYGGLKFLGAVIIATATAGWLIKEMK